MKFTHDWFYDNIPVWSRLLAEHRGMPDLRYLEIGVFEGRSTCWLLENILTHDDAHIECIDTFRGGMESAPSDSNFASVRQRFENNVLPWKNKVSLHVGESTDILPSLSGFFDFVYIDGSHQAKDVLSDAILSWRLLRPEGIVIFDDYEWNMFPESWRNPKLAINAFMQCFTGYHQILHVGYQLAIRKMGVYTPPAPRPPGAAERA